jgi:hypothetical protein
MKVETDNVDTVRALVRDAKLKLSTVGNKVSVTRKFYGTGLTTAVQLWADDTLPLVSRFKTKQVPLEYCITTVHF